jgi:hypothetical protein
MNDDPTLFEWLMLFLLVVGAGVAVAVTCAMILAHLFGWTS